MSAELLLQEFERTVDAPDAVARIRLFVLCLAMRGLLVSQTPTDEPAVELLARIAQTRRHRLRDGLSKASRANYGDIPAGDDFHLPPGWVRTNINDACDLQTGATPDRSRADYFGGDIPWLVSGDINQAQIFSCEGRISQLGLASSNCKLLPPDSVLIALNGQGKTRATVALLRISAACNQSLVAIVPLRSDCLLPEYLYWNLRSRYLPLRHLTGHGDRRGLNMKIISCLTISVPPAAEQRRIVAKVDELMALCDQLEAAQKARELRRDRLRSTSLERLAATDGDIATSAMDVRFFLDQAPRLVTKQDHVEELRRAIRELAVQGRLVKQDPADEPAEALLRRLVSKLPLTRPTKRQQIQDPLACPPLTRTPALWRWAHLSTICSEIADPDHKMPVAVAAGIPYVSARDLKDDGSIGFEDAKRISTADYERLARKLVPRRGDIIYSRIGTIGKARIVQTDVQFMISYSCCLIRPHNGVNASYLCLVLESRTTLRQAHNATQGIGVPDLGLGEIRRFRVPLPPVSEQQRIVTKVDELLTVCNELDAGLFSAQDRRSRLLEALLQDALGGRRVEPLPQATTA